jgi:hypothetical protein
MAVSGTQHGERFVPDADDLAFPDLGAAEVEAAKTAPCISRELLPRGNPREITTEIRNEGRHRASRNQGRQRYAEREVGRHDSREFAQNAVAGWMA